MMRLNSSFWVLLFSITLLSIQFKSSFGSASTKEAYVTLLYGDEFLLGVRVLGKSIRDTGSNKDMVVLVSDGVSDYSKKLLKADGWKIEKISLLANPNQVHPKRFWGVYTKLKIFNMTDYKKVVYLDADTIVVKNIDDMFKCSKFCANLKHSERLNSGVMVVEPSEALFNDMMMKVKTLSSYTGGDQGFLNSYYPDFPNARVFDPSLSPEAMKTRPVPKMERLSTLYNADVGLYMLANKWMVDDSKLHIIHYTLGPLKPWDWWTAWLVKPVEAWHSIRVRLEETLPGTGGGKTPNDEFMVKFLFLLPLFGLSFCLYRSIQGRDFLGSVCRSSLCIQIRHLYYKVRSNGTVGYSGVSTLSTMNPSYQLHTGSHSKVPQYLRAVSVAVCFVAALTSIGVSFMFVPRQIMPWTGLILIYEWTFTIFFLFYGSFLLLVYQYGKNIAVQTGSFSSQTESSLDDSGKGHQRGDASFDFTTCYYGLGMAFLAVAAISLPYILGVTALFLRLGLMIAVAMVLVSFMTYASEHLAIRWFLKGLENRDTTRTKSICFLC
ncbi:PREDICTED: inositol phosphorylceramide glucuronosyltransferase 1-like [Camelina sativa]|uniref:Hexosyltransferase n=1 Tax=Camelina sativa TaxID=90675 RepID=A0ABM0SNT1_CAMSA|nr:PREDICTED: inositol phosphorylceramide glucuronosyltransferase 1-like [Camelina sativa]